MALQTDTSERVTLQDLAKVPFWAYHNGAFIPFLMATLSVKSHLVHYASSVFEGLRYVVTRRGIFLFPEHMERLFGTSIPMMRYSLPPGPWANWEEFRRIYERAIILTVALNEGNNSYVRPWFGRGTRPHPDPNMRSGLRVHSKGVETVFGLVTEDWPTYIESKSGQLPIAFVYRDYERPRRTTSLTAAKEAMGYVIGDLASQAAEEAGANEALMGRTGPDGRWYPLDGPGQTAVIVEKGTMLTVDPNIEDVLRSTTQTWEFNYLAPRLNIPTRYETFSMQRLLAAQELLYLGSASGTVPFGQVWEQGPDGKLIKHLINGGQQGPVATKLLAGFNAMMTDDPWGEQFFTPVPTRDEALEEIFEQRRYRLA